ELRLPISPIPVHQDVGGHPCARHESKARRRADDRSPVELVLPLQQACNQNDQNGLKYRCGHSGSKDVKEPGERRSSKPFPFLNRTPQEVCQSDAVKEEEKKANENILAQSCEFSHYAEGDDAVSPPACDLARPVKPAVFQL